jgi:hypothetical protein
VPTAAPVGLPGGRRGGTLSAGTGGSGWPPGASYDLEAPGASSSGAGGGGGGGNVAGAPGGGDGPALAARLRGVWATFGRVAGFLPAGEEGEGGAVAPSAAPSAAGAGPGGGAPPAARAATGAAAGAAALPPGSGRRGGGGGGAPGPGTAGYPRAQGGRLASSATGLSLAAAPFLSPSGVERAYPVF